MFHQLTIPGFPEQKHREAYTGPSYPKKIEKARPYFGPLPQKISISPDCYTLFTDFSSVLKQKRDSGLIKPVKKEPVKGVLSRQSSRKLKNACTYTYLLSHQKTVKSDRTGRYSNFKVAFITLTLAADQMHSDGWIRENMLKHFIDAIRRKFPAFSYVWKGEAQKNKRIHFHIMTDHFIPFRYINKLWYKIQWEAGYMKKFYEANMGRFSEVDNTKDIVAPGAKIEEARDEEGLGRYMRKYMTKEIFTHAKLTNYLNELDRLYFDFFFAKSASKAQDIFFKIRKVKKKIEEFRKRKIEGKLWGCSDNLLCKPYGEFLEGMGSDNLDYLHNENPVIYSDDNVIVYKIQNFNEFLSRMSLWARDEIRKHFSKIIHEKAHLIPKKIVYNTNPKFDYSYG